MIKQRFVIEFETHVGITPDLLERGLKHICLQYGYLDFVGAENIKIEETKNDGMCPHNYYDWDLCPDCCH